MKTTIIAVIALAFVSGAAHAQWTIQQQPMYGGGYSTYATGPNGQSAQGITTPMYGGGSSTSWTNSNGHSSNCIKTPMFGGGYTMSCN